MSSTTLIEGFLLADCFVMGMIVMEVVRHARAHFGGSSAEKGLSLPKESPLPLPADLSDQVAAQARSQFAQTISASSELLQRDLASTGALINKQVKHLVTEVVSEELERYRTDLTALRERAVASMSGIEAEVEQQRTAMKAVLAADLQAEKQRLQAQLDTKLGDAVSAFLLETLQHNVDLGAQTAYLMATLEEHKPELIKGVTDEV